MNRLQESAEFKAAVKALLEEVARSAEGNALSSYSGSSNDEFLEHTTRRYFLDKLVMALGWTLGSSGDMAEEARVKAETTTYMDYLGVTERERLPVVIIEAKAWGTPFIAPKRDTSSIRLGHVELLVKTVANVRSRGSASDSAATAMWHGFIEQVWGYVKDLKEVHAHSVQRVALTSGQWLIVFIDPIKTLLSGSIDADDLLIVHRDQYVERSDELLEILGQRALVGHRPRTLRPAQLKSYAKGADVAAVFHAVYVRFEASGSAKFHLRPRVLTYPALIVQRGDGVLLAVVPDQDDLALGKCSLDEHFDGVEATAAELLRECCDVLSVTMAPSPLSRFPGFPQRAGRRDIAGPLAAMIEDQPDAPDEWLLVTGDAAHYLRRSPLIDRCEFHAWGGCRTAGKAAGANAVSVRSVRDPRAFFTDGEQHHCAHQDVLDRREMRCLIAPIDQRVCCQACRYTDICWEKEELSLLPCGM